MYILQVSEVMLFSNESAMANLHISFCQWPNDATKLVVYGYSTTTFDDEASLMEAESGGGSLSSRPCYLTVTAVPSLNGCKDCVRVASTYEEEDVAEAWNSCVR